VNNVTAALINSQRHKMFTSLWTKYIPIGRHWICLHLFFGWADIHVNRMFRIFTFVFLYFPIFMCAFTDNECYVKSNDYFYHEGDVTIGALFPLHILYTGNTLTDQSFPYNFQDYHIQ
jgi:hypothetical protein